MSLLDKMERKFGRYAIQDLMKYIIILYVVGMILRYATPGVYEAWFMLDASKIFLPFYCSLRILTCFLLSFRCISII